MPIGRILRQGPGSTTTGWLQNGTKFDSSRDRGQPFIFTLGVGQVIKGWDQGVAGMRVGDVVKLTLPPELGWKSGTKLRDLLASWAPMDDAVPEVEDLPLQPRDAL